MKANLLNLIEKKKLELLLSHSVIRGHYDHALPVYLKWRDLVCSFKIELLDGSKHTLSATEALAMLEEFILSYDFELRQKLGVVKTSVEVNSDVAEVAELFAKKVMSLPPIVSTKAKDN